MNKKNLLGICCICWSLCSIVTGSVNSLLALAISRFLLGVFSSATDPAAYSIIENYFPSKSLATANSIFASGMYYGTGLASLSVIMIDKLGWRSTYNWIGIIGVIIGALCLGIKEKEAK